nr:hypothetical protein [Salinibacter ruber]
MVEVEPEVGIADGLNETVVEPEKAFRRHLPKVGGRKHEDAPDPVLCRCAGQLDGVGEGRGPRPDQHAAGRNVGGQDRVEARQPLGDRQREPLARGAEEQHRVAAVIEKPLRVGGTRIVGEGQVRMKGSEAGGENAGGQARRHGKIDRCEKTDPCEKQ